MSLNVGLEKFPGISEKRGARLGREVGMVSLEKVGTLKNSWVFLLRGLF